MEQTTPMEETAEAEEHPGIPEGESPTKYELVLNFLFFRALLEILPSWWETLLCQASWNCVKTRTWNEYWCIAATRQQSLSVFTHS